MMWRMKDPQMKRTFFLVFLLFSAVDAMAEMSIADRKTADLIIKTCREVYKHKRPCPCPYDFNKKDELCSTESAYDKHRAQAPFCERSDVKPEDITLFRNMNESFITARCTAK